MLIHSHDLDSLETIAIERNLTRPTDLAVRCGPNPMMTIKCFSGQSCNGIPVAYIVQQLKTTDCLAKGQGDWARFSVAQSIEILLELAAAEQSSSIMLYHGRSSLFTADRGS